MDAAVFDFDAVFDHLRHGFRPQIAGVCRCPEIRIHAAGVDIANADIVSSGLFGEDLADAFHRILGCAVASGHGIVKETATGEDVDEQAAFPLGHHGINFLDHSKGADTVQFKHVPQIFQTDINDSVFFCVGTGIVYQHTNIAAEGILTGLNHSFAGCFSKAYRALIPARMNNRGMNQG